MHFKKLEIVGFKSFLNKTKLEFEPGVTAIVGPNGCGKSNIVDAIKWVLGEQSSKSMRSSAMQDVIFNGTEKYEPVNLSEVSLTLSNEDRALPLDYDEVTISRKLYRSGESLYLVNKTPVRLTDVRNLLMGTGMGTSSYSVVEQGRMDMILSSKPEERRFLFEEASGITRYKSKKREALIKLEHTQENLLRINDILREVERQIKAIERQARKAERYKVKFEELKGLEIKTAYRKYKSLTSENANIGSANDELSEIYGSLSAGVEELSSSLVQIKEEYNTLLEDLQASQGEVLQVSSDIDKFKHKMEINAERIQEFRKSVARLDWEIEEAAERKSALKSRLDSLKSRFEEVKQEREKKDQELGASDEKMRDINGKLEHHKNELKLNREKMVDIVSDQTKLKNALIKVDADTQNALSRKKRLNMEKAGVESEKENILEEIKSVDLKAEAANRELEDKKQEFYGFNDEYLKAQNRMSDLKNNKHENEKKLNTVKPRRQFLEKLIKDREGINQSVKDVMKQTERGDGSFSGVHGILSELVSVREDYEESLEAVLGGLAQAIVVEDRKTADSIVDYLRENSKESITLIVLDELKKMYGVTENKRIEGACLMDINGIFSAEESFLTCLRALLNDYFIADSFDDAKKTVEDKEDFSGIIVGKDGEIYRKGMRRTKNFSGKDIVPLLGRNEKVKQL
ncbi:MAG: AAA family ATPase, partial [Candidatus Omnitrophota bacterium]